MDSPRCLSGRCSGDPEGRVYLYVYEDSQWNLEEVFSISDIEDGTRFGFAIDIYGSTFVVGAPYIDDGSSNLGAVFIYRFNGVEYIRTKITASDRTSGDRFGSAIEIQANQVIVGAPGDDISFTKTERGWRSNVSLAATDR